MIKKDSLTDKCPWGNENHEECTLYRKGVRIVTTPHGEEQVPFESCAFNIIADCLENIVMRNVALQKEMNEVRNEVINVKNETFMTNRIFTEILNRQREFENNTRKIGE